MGAPAWNHAKWLMLKWQAQRIFVSDKRKSIFKINASHGEQWEQVTKDHKAPLWTLKRKKRKKKKNNYTEIKASLAHVGIDLQAKIRNNPVTDFSCCHFQPVLKW